MHACVHMHIKVKTMLSFLEPGVRTVSKDRSLLSL